MSPLRLLWYCLWVAPHLLQGIILFSMVRRKLHRQFPMFFFYSGFEILQFGILFAIFHSHLGFGAEYRGVYSLGLALSTTIRFGMIHELFKQFFRQYPALEASGRFLFRGATIVLLMVAIGLAVSAPGKSADFLVTATYAFDRTASTLQCGLLVSLFLFSRYFALSWRSPSFGIALGLGIFACVELAAAALRLQSGSFGNTVANLLVMATYNDCVLIWMFYLMAPERESQHRQKPMPTYDLEIWNQELQRLLQQ
jgi:hypothetical protein